MPPALPSATRVKKFVIDNFLVCGFSLALLFGLTVPAAGKELASWEVSSWSVTQTICVVVIFIISGATLKTEEISSALASGRRAYVYGAVSILGLTPVLGFLAVWLPYKPREYRYGLALFCCVPTTLTSGVTLVRNAKGNVALAMMLTVSTNLIGVFTVPFYYNAVVASGPALSGAVERSLTSEMTKQAIKLLVKLIFTILVPIVFGKLARESWPALSAAATKYKQELTLTNNSCLIIVVWMSISKSSSELKSTDAGTIFAVMFAGIVLHLVMLGINYVGTHAFGICGPERVASVMMSSQKTLPVAMTIISYLPEDVFGSPGLIAVPCIVCHITQLFMDAPLASHLAIRSDAKLAAAQPPTAAV
ncbi:Putative sodium bile acid cotransporter [Ostreococcus tauri]|nr:Putative sodium bile acid cotransporter [Ostreococcus tauri]CEG01104.1 Putative sodium bile acid cotransporter [Ostreococcus tauri]|eukprot:XP_022840793.1 Putative sodium bile acid cotransporter [Ostreococcus tauri]